MTFDDAMEWLADHEGTIRLGRFKGTAARSMRVELSDCYILKAITDVGVKHVKGGISLFQVNLIEAVEEIKTAVDAKRENAPTSAT